MSSLKEILGDDELFKQVSGKLNGTEVAIVPKGQKAFFHGPDDKVAIVNDGSWVPIKKFNDEHQLRVDSDKRLETIGEELDSLKKLKGVNEELQGKLTEMETNYKGELLVRDKQIALKDQLIEAGAKRKNAELLMPKFKLSDFELTEEGKIKDFDKLLEPVKKEYDHLFGKPVLKGQDPIMPKGAPEGFITKEQFLAMDEKERVANADIANKSAPFWNQK